MGVAMVVHTDTDADAAVLKAKRPGIVRIPIMRNVIGRVSIILLTRSSPLRGLKLSS
jgi:hypothetical protein